MDHFSRLLLGGIVALALVPAFAAIDPEVRSYDPHPQCMQRSGADADNATGEPDCRATGVQDCCWRHSGDATSPGSRE
jgi:hypothetical protein